MLDLKSLLTLTYLFCLGELSFKYFVNPPLVFRKVLVRHFVSFFRATPKLSVFCQPGLKNKWIYFWCYIKNRVNLNLNLNSNINTKIKIHNKADFCITG